MDLWEQRRGAAAGLAASAWEQHPVAVVTATSLAVVAVLTRLAGDKVVRVANGKVTLQLPMILYDLLVLLCYPFNWLVTFLVSLYSRTLWASDPSLAPHALAKSMDSLSPEQLHTLTAQILAREDVKYDEAHLVQLFDTLPRVSEDLIVGKAFKGLILRSGSLLDMVQLLLVKPINMLGFDWGKRFRTKFIGDPLFCNWRHRFYWPVPMWGNVSINDMDYRGGVQSSMRYDQQPWNDYFRVLSDEKGNLVFLGIWCSRDHNGGWFTLTHDQGVEVAF